MNHPLISIIVPVFNAEKFIRQTLSSIVNQTYIHWECVLVDDNSTDNSFAIITEISNADQRFRVFQRPAHLPGGGNGARNFGFEMAKGDYINWFDSDDVMLEDFLVCKIRALKPGHQLIMASGYFVDENLENRQPMPIGPTQTLFQDYLRWNIKLITNSILFKKTFLEGKRLFLYEMKKSQEAEFFSRIFFDLHPPDYLIIEEYTFLYRSHPNSLTSRNQVYNKEFKKSEVYMLLKNLDRCILIQDKPLSKSMYRLLVNQLFKALQNNHPENVAYIIQGLHAALYQKNKLLITIIEKMVQLHALTNLNLLRWDKVAKKMPVKI